MHLVFERSRGRFRSGCNILALAWTPYYNERQFRQALFDYHQRQLISSNGATEQSSTKNSRLAELRRRCNSITKSGGQPGDSTSRWAQMESEYDTKYGKMHDFGWLVIGNVEKLIGITLTSLVLPPLGSCAKLREDTVNNNNGDLIQFDEQTSGHPTVCSPNSSQSNHYELMRPDRKGVRHNYNLRGHLEEIILVRWNELYQKLATVDSKGNVLIWCKTNDKFTIQTPFYNRTKSVADFKWSNDGKTALICYTDSFILVGSSSGQRSWHSMLNLNDYHITCASWTPNDEQLLLGVSNGNIVVIDLPNNELTEMVVDETNIRAICWSTGEIGLRDCEDTGSCEPQNKAAPSTWDQEESPNLRAPESRRRRSSYGVNNTVVNQRRLSRDCSVFSRYRFCSQGPNNQAQPQQVPSKGEKKIAQESRTHDVLAIDFANNTIKLYENGLSDPKPTTIRVNQETYIMQWSGDGKTLAVAGFNIHTMAPTVGYLRCRYLNAIKFYNQQGRLIHEHVMKYSRYPITAFTWAHDDKRLFVATGQRLHCAKVFPGVPKLSLLALSNFQRFTKLPDKSDILESVVGHRFSPNILDWQSHNCPIDLAKAETDPTVVRNNCLVHQYRLPSKLLSKIDQLFASTIRQPYDESWTLNDIVWRVPSGGQRYYCTLICYASEREVNLNHHQYRLGASNEGPSDDHIHDQNKIFVLYVEFQGSLIPILRARRIGYLKPEFVIFDPDDGHSSQQKQQKVSDISQQPNRANSMMMPQRRQNINLIPQATDSGRNRRPSGPVDLLTSDLVPPFGNPTIDDNCLDLHNQCADIRRTSEASLSGHLSPSDTEHYYNFDCDSADRQNQKRLAQMASGRSHHQEPLPLLTSNPHLMMLMMGCPPSPDYYHHHAHQRSQQKLTPGAEPSLMDASAQTPKRTARARRRLRETGLSTSLSETSELIRIKSNIWGTKFKLINKANRMIRYRSVIGSVTYKASILHLQPRQIHLGLKDMSNYCCLCSKHHHRPLSASKSRSGVSKNSPDNSLLESSRRPKRPTNNNDKVTLEVGDSIRIAPAPDRLTRWKPPNLPRQHSDVPHLSGRRQSKLSDKRHVSSIAKSLASNKPNSVDLYGEPSTSSSQKDDILTLSLGQGDQVKVEMSSIRALDGDNDTVRAPSRQEDEFLAMNKTLKSIQTITKMIVDLSSRADSDELRPSDLLSDKQLASPNKVVKRCEGDSPTSVAFVAPQAPVHRPRRVVASKYLYDDFRGTQSATSTPLRSSRRSRSRERRQTDQRPVPVPMQPAAPLPPPPLPVPIRRRISASAKRFIDGSLRSLSLSSAGYSTAGSDLEPEESEPLVAKPSGRWLMSGDLARGKRFGPNSQPCSPMRGSSPASTRAFRNQADAFLSSASSFKSQLMSRLMNGPPIAGVNNQQRNEQRYKRSLSRSDKSDAARAVGRDYDDSDSDELDCCLDSSELDSDSDDNFEPGAPRTKPRGVASRKAPSGAFSASVKDLRELKTTADTRCHDNGPQQRTGQSGRNKEKGKGKRRRKSICPNANCCCAKEFRLNNRPPVWNEASQVYQLDFGGRVTQESAKNLQIDCDGNLALQFGRINRCTYTLDYNYPFNAVQAMAIALASLTQRLK